LLLIRVFSMPRESRLVICFLLFKDFFTHETGAT
jgi:hypothetical protein